MKIYLAGPMSGIPYFNFPAFTVAAQNLRNQNYTVFSPHEKDIERLGFDFSVQCPNGNPEELKKFGFSLRMALRDDLVYICEEADGIALMPGWENSKGANAEWATAKALGLQFLYLR
jgi:hypothetical protein